jgi:hypothetical protein
MSAIIRVCDTKRTRHLCARYRSDLVTPVNRLTSFYTHQRALLVLYDRDILAHTRTGVAGHYSFN